MSFHVNVDIGIGAARWQKEKSPEQYGTFFTSSTEPYYDSLTKQSL